MRVSTRLVQLAVLAAALSAAGCGAGGATASPQVNLSISAPTNGATVGVHKVTITGIVTPAGAQVAVNGQPAQVTGSSFTGTLYVSTLNQKIVVSGAAHGYLGAQANTTVSYSPNLAAQLVTSAPSAAQPATTQVSNTRATVSAITSAFGLPSNAPKRITKAGPAKPTGGSSSQPSSSTPTGGSGTNRPSSPTSGSGAPSGSRGSTTPAPPTAAQIAAAIRQAWVHGCVTVKAGQNIVPYCTCTYNHLVGQLQTQAAADHLLNELKPYLRTGDISKLPKIVRNAVTACISKLPPLDPVTGTPVVRKLPGVQHGALPAATPTLTTPTPAPVPPASASPAAPAARSAANSSLPQLSRLPFQKLGNAVSVKRPAAATPADSGAVSQTHSGAAQGRLAPQSGHQWMHRLSVVAQALGYAVRWVGDHNGSGAYPYGYRVQRRLYQHFRAAFRLAA
jgi:hypothetical protein